MKNLKSIDSGSAGRKGHEHPIRLRVRHFKAVKFGSAAAFTLVEVLVASAVLGIVMAILLGTLSTSMVLWRNTEGRLSADREGRAAELLLAQDIANAVMTTNISTWPVVESGKLRFLTAKPPDYQDDSGDTGDVCMVEYSISTNNNSLVRNFVGSSDTFPGVANAILNGTAIPSPAASGEQPLALNVFQDLSTALRGSPVANNGEQPKTNFVILGTNMLKIQPPYAASNPPTAVLINVGVGDPDAIANQDLLSNPNYKPRNANFFTFRLPFPKVSSQ